MVQVFFWHATYVMIDCPCHLSKQRSYIGLFVRPLALVTLRTERKRNFDFGEMRYTERQIHIYYVPREPPPPLWIGSWKDAQTWVAILCNLRRFVHQFPLLLLVGGARQDQIGPDAKARTHTNT